MTWLDSWLSTKKLLDEAEQALVFVFFEASHDDDTFAEHPPVVRIILTENKVDNNKISELTKSSPYYYMSKNLPNDRKMIIVDMEEKSEKRLWALILPENEWSEVYKPKWLPVILAKGETSNLIISLQRKKQPDLEPNASEE